MSHTPDPIEKLPIEALLEQRILILDGAMGTMIQRYKLTEEHYRGMVAHGGHAGARQNFVDHLLDLKGNNDLLTLTQPQIIREIHAQYLEAGADILETNTFNANAVSMDDYQMGHLVYELNFEAAKLARGVCDEFEAKTPGKPRFVAGVLGPTTRTASISPDVNDPGSGDDRDQRGEQQHRHHRAFHPRARGEIGAQPEEPERATGKAEQQRGGQPDPAEQPQRVAERLDQRGSALVKDPRGAPLGHRQRLGQHGIALHPERRERGGCRVRQHLADDQLRGDARPDDREQQRRDRGPQRDVPAMVPGQRMQSLARGPLERPRARPRRQPPDKPQPEGKEDQDGWRGHRFRAR